MILTKSLKIKNSNFYKSKGYISDLEGFIEINIEDLPYSSTHLILSKCDFCEFEKKISFKVYIKNKKNGDMFCCSKKCSLEKTKKTNLEKYGVEYLSQNENIKEKIKKTNLEKYGVEFTFQNEDIKDKIKETNLEKYGVEFVLQSKEIKDKSKKTNLEKYGVDNVSKIDFIKKKKKETTFNNYGVYYPLQNENIKEKLKFDNLEKYGFEYATQNKNIKEKTKITNLNKYEVEYGLQNVNIKEKSKKSNLNKYGVEFFSKSEISKLNSVIGQHPNYIKYIDDRISLFKCDLNKEHEFKINSDNFHGRIKSNLPLCTICYPIGDQKSIKEKILLEYITSIYSGKVISGYRDGLEIDIYLPELKIGIEFNGLYWHSNKFKDSNYHINKQIYFKEKDINIKFIYEDDFDNKLDIIKSQINNWLKLTQNKIYARKCQVKQITNTEEYRNFLEKNHIQGYVASKLVYGLYHQDQLVSLMCFDKKEGRLNMSENEWNLSRFCNLLNHQVIGGASKLLNHFIKENNPSRIISYADKDWSSGNLYFTLGFKILSESKPDYKYIVDGLRKSKQNFTKTKLEKLGYDISLTESQIMENLGINRIYDCGKMKFELIMY